MIYVESYVNNDAPGFVSLGWKVAALDAWSTATIAGGYRLFSDWLDALTAAITGYTFSYDTATDRVIITPGGGATARYFKFSESFAQLIGFATEPGQLTTATSGTSAPAGIVPAYSADFGRPTPARQSELRAWGHKRARALVWGDGELYRVKAPILYSDLTRALSGPCTAGRVRIGSYGGSDVYGSANLDGYIDGYVLRVHEPAGLDGVEGIAELSLEIHAGASPSSPDPFSVCYGSLTRGYSWGLYAKVEGLPYRFCEVDPGWTDSARPTSATLVIDQNTSIAWRTDREGGIAGGGPLRIGILDPDNDTAIWGRPTISAEVEADFSSTASILRVDDASPFTSGTAFYLGKERVTYSGTNTATTPNQITGCTRGAVNDKFEHKAGSPGNWSTITDKPTQWAGRLIELHAALLDPFGRACGSDWEDATATTMLFRGEITGAPGYDGGLWILHAHPLEKRLTRELSVQGSGHVHPGIPGAIGGHASEGLKPLVVLSEAESIKITFRWKGEYHTYLEVTGAQLIAASPEMVIGSSGVRHVVDYTDLIYSIFKKSWDLEVTLDPDEMAASWSSEAATIGAYVVPTAYKFERHEDTGSVVFYVEDMKIAYEMDERVEIDYAPGNGSPDWWRTSITVKHGVVHGGTQTETMDSSPMTTGTTGKNVKSLVITQDPDNAELMGEWPATGYYFAEGGEEEIGQYAGKIDVTDQSITVLYGLTRAQHGQSADLWDPDTKAEAVERYTGSYGAQLLSMMQSSGLALRGAYDTKGAHAGYGIDDGRIDESSILATLKWSPPVLMAGKTSLDKTYGSLLAALRLNLGPVRDGQALKIGSYTTRPVGPVTQKLRDSDIRRARGPSVERVSVGPNIVDMEHSDAPGMELGAANTYRLISDIQARGGVRRKYKIPGPGGMLFSSVSQSAAAAIMLNGHDLIAYRFRVGGHKDWLVGQIVDIDISHPAIWDWSANTTGLDALGVIAETRRSMSGEVDVVILVGGSGRPGALCPAVKIASRSGSDLTLAENTFPNGEPIFLSGDGVLLYRPGVSGEYTEQKFTSVSGVTATLDAVPSWLSSVDLTDATVGIVYASYPSDDDADITAAQAAYAHVGDGTIWS